MPPLSRPTVLACVVAALLACPVPAAAQKDAFVDAFVVLHAALLGAYGDEGPEVSATLGRMAAALDAWEQSQAAAESALKARGAAPEELALLYADAGRLDEAIAAVQAAMATEGSRGAVRGTPRLAALSVFLGLLHDARGQPADAAAAFEAAARLDPGDPVAAYLWADRLAERGADDLSPHVASLLAAVDRGAVLPRRPFAEFGLVNDLAAPTPIFAPAAYAEGFAAIARGRFRDGVELLRAAAARDPLVSGPAAGHDRVLRGIRALRSRDGATAVAELETAVRALPGSSEAQRVLGIVYRAVRRLPESIEAFSQAVAVAPADERARVALGTTLAMAGRLEEAADVLQETIALLPASGTARWALADVYGAGGHEVDAIRLLDDASARGVVSGRVHLYWRIAELAHGYRRDAEQVIAVLSRRARVVRNHPHAHKDLGLAYLRAGRDEASLAELLLAILLGLSDAETHQSIGQIHLNAGRLDRAETSLRRAIALDPAAAHAHYSLGLALQRLGRTTEAKAALAEFERLRTAAFDEQRRKFEAETGAAR